MPINLFSGSMGDGENADRLGGGKIAPGFAVGGKPNSLSAWRFISEDPDVAASALENFGASEDAAAAKLMKVKDFNSVIEVGEDDELKYEVFSATDSLNITVQPGGIGTSLVLWGNNKKIAETDGTHLIEEGVITDEISPMTNGKSLDEIIDMGFKPNLRLNFTFTDHPDMGNFVLFSGAKTALENFAIREAELAELDAEVTTTIALEFRKSKRGGFYRPQIGRLTPTESAESDDNSSTPTKPAAKAAAKPAAKKAATRKRVTK